MDDNIKTELMIIVSNYAAIESAIRITEGIATSVGDLDTGIDASEYSRLRAILYDARRDLMKRIDEVQ